MISGTNLRPFTLYSLDATGCSARCCYQSKTSKIICSLKGPNYSGRLLNSLVQVTIKGYDAKPSLLRLLQQILVTSIVLENYEKASFEYEIEILESPSIVLSELLSILCYTTCCTEVPIKDIFTGAVVGFIDDQIFLDPTLQQLSECSITLTLAYLVTKKKMIHLEVCGKSSLSNIQKMLSLGIGGCSAIGSFIEQKLIEA